MMKNPIPKSSYFIPPSIQLAECPLRRWCVGKHITGQREPDPRSCVLLVEKSRPKTKVKFCNDSAGSFRFAGFS